jgi:hypothetical protein
MQLAINAFIEADVSGGCYNDKAISIMKELIEENKEIETLSALTGLPKTFLWQDRSISMPWHEIIIPRLIVKDKAVDQSIRNFKRLLLLGFSEKFIRSRNFDNTEDDDEFSISEILHIFIEYAIKKVRHKLPLADENGFPILSELFGRHLYPLADESRFPIKKTI